MNRIAFEFRRKTIHIIFGLAIVILLYFNLLNAVLLGVLVVVGIILSLIEKDKRLPVLSKLLDLFEREDARKRMPGEGLIFYLAGALVSVILFPKDVAMASITVLAIGDAVSHLAGIGIGKIKHPFNDRKFLEGWLAGVVAAFIACLFFIGIEEAFVGTIAGMLIEVFDIVVMNRRVNDNFLIPPFAGLAIIALRILKR
ncbi:MAG TPA: SEC59/DGK1/VTE5 family protein [Candidatus Nanoarchaeia archaeon]|nr:SEC59/DGK1/VTE5 family protein [Candidatus Nanoarchaeia archaeon]